MRQFFIIFLLLGFFSKVWGQQEHFFGDIFEKLLKNFDADMEQEIKRFEKFFQTSPFLGLDKVSPLFENVEMEHFWRETKEQKILVFKVDASSKEIPFNIQIKDGHIVVKGTVQKQTKNIDSTTGATSFSSNVYQFQHGPILIPLDVDEGGVKIEKVRGEVLIRFPKKKGVMAKPAQKKQKPLPREKGDLTI